MSNATVTTISEGDFVQVAGSTVAPSTYAELSNRIVLSVEDADNHHAQLFIPSPKLSLLLADRISRNPATTEWTTLEADLSSLSIPFSGLPIVTLHSAVTAFMTGEMFETYNNFNTGIGWVRRSLWWYDTMGHSVITHLCGPPGGSPDLGGVMNDFQAVSNATVTHYVEHSLEIFTDTPTTDLYNSVHDYAALSFVDDHGNMSTVMLPAPARAIFLADGKTVNAAQANVADFIAQALLQLTVPQSGLPVSTFLGGQLRKSTLY